MKNIFLGIAILIFAVSIHSCSKDSFITSPDALLTTSADTLHFDTVFTTIGSVTHSFKIFNLNDQKLRLSAVKLMGGAGSAFKMNVDGSAGTSFNNIEVAPNDSVYVFVTVTVNPTAANLPFVVRDSVLINYNGNNDFIQLEAYGQNANYLRNQKITGNTSFNNVLPFVILGGLTVDTNATLSINKGCRIYCHADAPIIVNGTLKVNGEKFDSTRVRFQSDRLDPDYKDFPGSWPGIFFSSTSKDNVLNYAVIKNAYQGIITQLPSSNSNAKVTLNQCIIDNIYDAGILSVYSSINATNCLISNCGNNIGIVGGTYNFNHCTVASYSNVYLSHKNPVLFISNTNDTQTLPLSAIFRNCIFWGEGGSVDDEISIDKKVPAGAVVFQNILYKGKADVLPTTNIKNQVPLFDSTDVGRRYFDFHLQLASPARNTATRSLPLTTIDLDGNPRDLQPDMGCYERQP